MTRKGQERTSKETRIITKITIFKIIGLWTNSWLLFVPLPHCLRIHRVKRKYLLLTFLSGIVAYTKLILFFLDILYRWQRICWLLQLGSVQLKGPRHLSGGFLAFILLLNLHIDILIFNISYTNLHTYVLYYYSDLNCIFFSLELWFCGWSFRERHR